MTILSPFLIICSAGLFAIFSSTISKSPVLPLYAAHLGANPADVGLIASVSAFTGVIASVPAGLLSDRFGRRRMLLISLIIFASAPLMYLPVSSLYQLAAVRFYHGFATALFVPVAMAFVADLSSTSRGERLGWFSSSTLAGRFLAPLAGGAVIGLLAYNPALGYKTVYVICGISGTLALIAFLLVKAPEGDKKPQIGNWQNTWSSFIKVVSSRAVLMTSSVEASILFAYGTFETFIPLYCLKNGISPYEVGIILSSQVITIALTKPAMGRFSDRHGREGQIFWGALTGTCCIGGFAIFSSFLPFLLLSIAFGLSLSIVTSATSALMADLSDKGSRGSAMGILGSIMDIGHSTGPIVAGIAAAAFNYEAAFLTSAIVLITTAFTFRLCL